MFVWSFMWFRCSKPPCSEAPAQRHLRSELSWFQEGSEHTLSLMLERIQAPHEGGSRWSDGCFHLHEVFL